MFALFVTNSPSSTLIGRGVFFLGVKRPEREVDDSHLSSAKVEHEWSYDTLFIFMPPWHGYGKLYVILCLSYVNRNLIFLSWNCCSFIQWGTLVLPLKFM